MHGACLCVNFFSAVKGHRAGKSIAASHPLFGLTVAKDTGIEYVSIERLHADHTAASLVEVIELDPCFERLFLQSERVRLRCNPCVLTV